MGCLKYTLTNTGSTVITFNYQRCDDAEWQYQVELLPNQTKNIWLIDSTFSISDSFLFDVDLTNQGEFPFVPASPTPTPSITPSNTPTPSITPTQTNTPTNTGTPTNTPTNTPTPTNVVRYEFSDVCRDFSDPADVCNCGDGVSSIFLNTNDPATATLAWANAVDGNDYDPAGWYVFSGSVYQIDPGCGSGCTSGSTFGYYGTVCGPTPTPTITPTQTPTPTPSSYAFSMKFSVVGGAEACSSGVTGTYYSNSATLDGINPFLTTDSSLTTPASNGYYCLAAGCPNSTGKQFVQVTGGSGAITSSTNC